MNCIDRKANKDLPTWNWLSGLTAASSLIALVGCAIAFNCKTVFFLDKDQFLYIYSTMAQVTAGLFGLTLTSYVFFADKFAKSAEYEENYEATISLLWQYYWDLILISIACGITILLCIIGLISLDNNVGLFYSYIINTSVLFCIISTLSILLFGILLLYPNKLIEEIYNMTKEAERNLQKKANASIVEEKSDANLSTFLGAYNRLEKLIVEFAEKLNNDQNISSQVRRNYRGANIERQQRPQILQSIDTLSRNEILNGRLCSELHELRKYRNGLVHGLDFDTPISVCNRIEEIYNALNQVFKVYKESGARTNDWNKAVQNIYVL